MGESPASPPLPGLPHHVRWSIAIFQDTPPGLSPGVPGGLGPSYPQVRWVLAPGTYLGSAIG